MLRRIRLSCLTVGLLGALATTGPARAEEPPAPSGALSAPWSSAPETTSREPEGARLQATLDYYAQRARRSRTAVGWGLLGAGVAGAGAATYLQLQWKDTGAAVATGLLAGGLAVDSLVAFTVTSPFENLAAYGHAGASPVALADAWTRAARREHRARRVSAILDLVAGGLTLGLGAVALLGTNSSSGSNGSGAESDALGSVLLGAGAVETILGAYMLGTDGPLETGLRAYEACSRPDPAAPAEASALGPVRIGFVPGGAVAGFGANF